MTQILTVSGRQIKLGGPAMYAPENAPSVREIGHSLAQINRYTGHCKRPYSVAEHSLLAADIACSVFGATPIVELAVLFHDAHESICGDVSSPVKQMLGQVWRSFEHSLQCLVLGHYQLNRVFEANEDIIKHCDLIALATERRDLTAFNPDLHDPWPSIDSNDERMVITPRGTNLMSYTRRNTQWCEWAQAFERRALYLIAMDDLINFPSRHALDLIKTNLGDPPQVSKATAEILAN